MFCFQCEQTAKGQGCTKIGVCGKQPDTAALQDLLIHAVKGLAVVAQAGVKAGVRDSAVDQFICEAIFSTLTNVDFDPDRFVALINACVTRRDALAAKVRAAGGQVETGNAAVAFKPEAR
jgi:hydroxylamine reductase